MSFDNKVVVITGASSGIGAAVAVLFAKEKANVVIVGRNENNLAEVAKTIKSIGKTPLIIKADVSNDEDAKRIVNETIAAYGKIDVFVNNAGFTQSAAILDANVMEAYDAIMATNLRAVVHLTALAAPHLIKTKGNIVNISSVAGMTTPHSPTFINYAISNAGLTHFSKGAALELSQYGVRVNVVSPGSVVTNFTKNNKLSYKTEDFASKMPLKRVTQPEEIAELIAYLASDKAKGITCSGFVSDNGGLLSRLENLRLKTH